MAELNTLNDPVLKFWVFGYERVRQTNTFLTLMLTGISIMFRVHTQWEQNLIFEVLTGPF